MKITSLYNKGSVLLESVVALAVIIIVTAAISTVVSISVSNSTFTRNQNQANKFAQEGIEYMRALTQSDYSHFIDILVPNDTTTNTFCFNRNFELLEEFGPRAGECFDVSGGTSDLVFEQGFRRQVQVKQDCGSGTPDPGDAEVTVTVSWSSGRCPQTNTFCHEARFVSCITSPGSESLL